MDIVEIKKERLMRGYEVTVPANVIDAKVNEQIDDYIARARIPGFRPGSLPRDVAVKRFGDALRKDIINEYTSDVLREIVKQYKIVAVASEPKVDTDTSVEGVIKYNVSFEIQPEVPTINLSTVSISLNKVVISEKDVEKTINDQFEQSNTKWIPSNAPAQNGDKVGVRYTTRVRNKILDRDFSTQIVLGRLEKFDANLLGKSAGDVLKFDYEYKPGKLLSYDLTITEVASPGKFDKADDEYAKSRGLKDFEDLKATTRKFMEDRAESLYAMEKVGAIRNVLLECVPELTTPEAFVNMEAYLLSREYAAGRLDLPEIDASKSDEDRKRVLLDLAVRDVKIGLIIRKLGADHNIKVTERDVRKAIGDRRISSENELREIESRIFEDKVFAKIESLITIDTKEISLEEFEKLHPQPVSDDRDDGGANDVSGKKTKGKVKQEGSSREESGYVKLEEEGGADGETSASAKKPATKKTPKTTDKSKE